MFFSDSRTLLKALQIGMCLNFFDLAQAYSIPLSEAIGKSERQVKKPSRRDSWTLIEDEVGRLPSKKRTYCANIMKEVLAGDR